MLKISAAAAFLSLWLVSFALQASSPEWRPVSPEELALKESRISSGADAECLFKDVRMNDDVGEGMRDVTTYIRFKIFTDHGREKYSNRTIPYSQSAKISDFQARTIHPDGSIIDLDKDAILKKVVAKVKGTKLNSMAFAFPAVENGSIIEYRWKETMPIFLFSPLSPYFPFTVQEEFPIDEVAFHLKATTRLNAYTIHFIPFHCTLDFKEKEGKGFSSFSVHNVPAYQPEPFSPPERSVKQWVLISYDSVQNSTEQKVWDSYAAGQNLVLAVFRKTFADKTGKPDLNAIIAGAKTDDEKLSAIARYCRQVTKHEEDDAEEGVKQTVNPRFERVLLFLDLALAAGYDARLARMASRSLIIFNPKMESPFFLGVYQAAVAVNGKWKFFDLSNENVPLGTLPWPDQGDWAFLIGPTTSEWVKTPLLPADQTKIKRIAKLTLSANGDLEGSVATQLFGNEAINWRSRFAKANQDEREEPIRARFKASFSDCDVRDIQFTSSADPTRPVEILYHVLVHGYAQHTGHRIFLHPSFFAAGHSARFTDSNRSSSIYFDYPWSEEDIVEIVLPKDFALDHPDRPEPIQQPLVTYALNMGIRNTTNTLVIQRLFSFGASEVPWFEPKHYPVLKALFTQIQTNDDHMLSLKAIDAPAAPPAAGH